MYIQYILTRPFIGVVTPFVAGSGAHLVDPSIFSEHVSFREGTGMSLVLSKWILMPIK